MAKSKKTRNEYEQHLNETYTDIYTEDDAVDKLSHLGTATTIRKRHARRELGTLVRAKDVVAFNVGYGEWCK